MRFGCILGLGFSMQHIEAVDVLSLLRFRDRSSGSGFRMDLGLRIESKV